MIYELNGTISRFWFFGLLVALAFFSSEVSAGTYTVGVKVGDWAGYGDVSFEWASNIPEVGGPPSGLNMSWMDMEVMDVDNSNITARSDVIYKNGTEETYTAWGDIATGEGNLGVGIIPTNIGAGDEIPTNLTYFTEEPLKLSINGTLTRNYAGANREVNYVNITTPVINGNITYGSWNLSLCWDKKTGIMCEERYSYGMSYTMNETDYYYNMSMLWKMTATNMWDAVFTVQDGYTFNITIASNSTISNFDFDESVKQISFNLTGPNGKMGYCNVTIPKDFLKGEPWMILLNGTDYVTACSVTESDTHASIHIPYSCSTSTVQIIGTWVIPEFPYIMILLLFTIFSIIAVALTKKIRLLEYR